jgi:hypothetical protein
MGDGFFVHCFGGTKSNEGGLPLSATDQNSRFCWLPWLFPEVNEIIYESPAQGQVSSFYWNFHQVCMFGKSVPEFAM